MIFGMFDVVRKTARKAGQNLLRADVNLPLMAALTAAMPQEELWLVRSTYYLLPTDISMPPFQSAFWNGDRAAVLFSVFTMLYRFRQADFVDMLLRMDLATEVGGDLQFKDLLYHYGARFPADFAMMVMLRRLGFSCRFADLICDPDYEFGKATKYICEAFHTAIDYVFLKFARGGLCPFLWEDSFMSFAEAFNILGSPIPTIIGLMDGLMERRAAGGVATGDTASAFAVAAGRLSRGVICVLLLSMAGEARSSARPHD